MSRGRSAFLQRTRLAVIIVAVVAPFVGFALHAFSSRWFFPQFVPSNWSMDAWERLFSGRSKVPGALLTSVVLAASVTAVSIIIGLPAARAMGLYEFRFKRVLRLMILSPALVPPLAVAMGLSVTFIRLGLGGTLFGVGLVHLVPVLPYVVLTLTGIFANYPTAYEDQARTLGAGPIRIFLRITLPTILPGVVVAGLFAFLISWSQYVLTLLIGGGRIVTMPVLLFSAIPGGDNAAIAVQSLIFIAPSLVILAFTSRHLTGKSAALRGLGL